MEFFILIKRESYENISIVLFSLIFAVTSVYAAKFFSVLLPFLACTFFLVQKRWQNFKFDLPFLAIFFTLLICLSGLSILWAINGKAALKTFYPLSMTLVFSYLFLTSILKTQPDFILKVYKALLIASLFLAILIIFQSAMNAFEIKPFAQEFTHLLKPAGSVLGLLGFVTCALLWAKDRKILAVSSFILLGILIKLTVCQTAIYAFVLASAFFAISYLAPLWTTRLAMGGSFALLLGTPFLHAYLIRPFEIVNNTYFSLFFKNSFFHRLLIWEYFSHRFFEKPLLGWGLGSSRYNYDKPKAIYAFDNVIHPHKSVLQAYVELGVFGGVLFSLFVAVLFWLIQKHVKDRLSVAVCNATLLFWLVLADMTHNLWRNYYLSLATITAGLVILFVRDRGALPHVASGRSKLSPVPA